MKSFGIKNAFSMSVEEGLLNTLNKSQAERNSTENSIYSTFFVAVKDQVKTSTLINL